MHFRRLSSLLDRSKGEKVGGVMEGRRNAQKRRLEPVIVKGVNGDDSLLEEYVVIVRSCILLDNLYSIISERYLDPYYPSLLWMV